MLWDAMGMPFLANKHHLDPELSCTYLQFRSCREGGSEGFLEAASVEDLSPNRSTMALKSTLNNS